MKNLIILIAITSYSTISWSWQDTVKDIIHQELKKTKISESNFGIWMGVGDQQVSINADKLFLPASLSKVVTASAVFHHLPADHKFKTQILTNGKINDIKLNGDLYLKGGGDPAFVSESMWYLVNVLKRQSFREITGDIIVDDSMYDKIRFSESRQSQRVDRAYDAPVGAMSFNWNSVNVFVKPGKQVGDPAQVYLDPKNEYTVLVNQTKTNASSGKFDVQAERFELPDGKNKIVVSGGMPLNQEEKPIYKSISNPDLWAGYNLKAFLEEAGFKVQGQIKLGVTQASSKLLAEKESDSLSMLVSDMQKFSNNYVAEMLTKYLGYYVHQKGTLKDGVKVLQDYLTQTVGWPEGDFVFINPSGLTRENKVKPMLLGKLLQKDWNKFSIAPELVSSLPIAGIDGTLKKRMQGKLKGLIRAKTGFLNGVTGIAGFMSINGKEPVTFVMIYNGSSDNDWQIRNIFDDILEKVQPKIASQFKTSDLIVDVRKRRHNKAIN